MGACDKNILSTRGLTAEMIHLANQGDKDRQDTGCGVFYGILRDRADKLKQLAEKEKQAHIEKGLWKQHEWRTVGSTVQTITDRQ